MYGKAKKTAIGSLFNIAGVNFDFIMALIAG
jgi:hypothetical protein